MSVLECRRNGCDYVMCDLVSDDHGYICKECFDEMANCFRDYGLTPSMITPHHIETFLGVRKKTENVDSDDRTIEDVLWSFYNIRD